MMIKAKAWAVVVTVDTRKEASNLLQAVLFAGHKRVRIVDAATVTVQLPPEKRKKARTRICPSCTGRKHYYSGDGQTFKRYTCVTCGGTGEIPKPHRKAAKGGRGK